MSREIAPAAQRWLCTLQRRRDALSEVRHQVDALRSLTAAASLCRARTDRKAIREAIRAVRTSLRLSVRIAVEGHRVDVWNVLDALGIPYRHAAIVPGLFEYVAEKGAIDADG